MPFVPPRPTDPIFGLAQMLDADIDLARGALLIAREAYPDIDPETYLLQLDDMAASIRPQSQRTSSLEARLHLLNHYLFVDLGFRGTREKAQDPRTSYLNQVLERRLGIPISLSVVYLAVGQRLGLPLEGVSFPWHFLVKCTAPPEPIFIDAFREGQLLSIGDLENLMPEIGGEKMVLEERFLQAAPAKHILARMLRNLKHICVNEKQYRQAIDLGEKITWLHPEEAYDYRDLGFLYFQIRDYHKSLAALEEYLRRAENPADEKDIRQHIQTLLGHLARLN